MMNGRACLLSLCFVASKGSHARTSAGFSTTWITTGVLGFLLWLALLVFLGLRTLRHGHWVMFLVGIVLPIFWIIGALISRRR